MIKIFPDVKVELKKLVTKSPYFSKLLYSEERDPISYIAQLMLLSVESKRMLVGATIDEYVSRALEDAQKEGIIFHYNEKDFLDFMIKNFVKLNLVYGVIEEESKPNSVERIIEDYSVLQKFLSTGSGCYVAKNVNRTIFVPSDLLTQIAWGFKYDKNFLRNMHDSL
ncbi:MAG: hypothetical protein QXW00_02600 [Candidatus Woesearchaeota archaeon]